MVSCGVFFLALVFFLKDLVMIQDRHVQARHMRTQDIGITPTQGWWWLHENGTLFNYTVARGGDRRRLDRRGGRAPRRGLTFAGAGDGGHGID